MQKNILLEQIWSQSILVPEVGEVSPLSSILESLLSVRIVTLVQNSNSFAVPYTMLEDTVVLPGVSLGDVLAEEFNINVSKHSIVLVESARLANAEQYDPKEIGEMLGRILIDIATNNQNFSDAHKPAMSKFRKLVEDIRDQGAIVHANGTVVSAESPQCFGT